MNSLVNRWLASTLPRCFSIQAGPESFFPALTLCLRKIVFVFWVHLAPSYFIHFLYSLMWSCWHTWLQTLNLTLKLFIIFYFFNANNRHLSNTFYVPGTVEPACNILLKATPAQVMSHYYCHWKGWSERGPGAQQFFHWQTTHSAGSSHLNPGSLSFRAHAGTIRLSTCSKWPPWAHLF